MVAQSNPQQYRVFLVGCGGHVVGVAEVISAGSDEEAVEVAARLTCGRAAEVWSGARLVSKLNLKLTAVSLDPSASLPEAAVSPPRLPRQIL